MTARSDVRVILSILVSLSTCLCTPLVFGTNWDVSWYFEVAARMLDGERPYVDFVDVNLPVALFVYMPASWLSQAVGGAPVYWLAAGMALLVAPLSARVSAQAGRAHESGAGSELAWLLLSAFALAGCSASDFGQREHLAILFVLPFACTVLGDRDLNMANGVSRRVGLAFVAGIGFAIKPYFGIPWLVLCVLTLKRVTWRHGAMLGAVSAAPMAIQLVMLPVLYPELLNLYRGFGDAYRRFWSDSPSHLLLRYSYIPAGAALLWYTQKRSQAEPALVAGLLWLSLSWYAAALVQGKGWSYHFIAASICLLFAYVVSLAVRVNGGDRGSRRVVLAALALLCAATVSQHAASSADAGARSGGALDLCPLDCKALPFAIRTSSAYPLLSELGARHAGSMSALWPLQAEYGRSGSGGQRIVTRAPADMRGVEDWLFRRTVRDMLERQPELLVVEEGFDSAFGGAYFDYLEYFSQDARFGEILGRYKKGPMVGHVRLYLREDLGN